MNFGFWNFYTLFRKNRLFEEGFTPVGDELAHGSVHLAKRLRALGHDVQTIDMKPLEYFDKIFFIDYPTMLNPYFRQLRKMKHPQVHLHLAEPPIVRPDNYNPRKHEFFKTVLTWKKSMPARDPEKYKFFPVANKYRPDSFSPVPYSQRKLCVMINSFMASNRSNELYSERVRAIHWFEKNAPQDFDLIGLNWDKPLFTGSLSLANYPLRFMYRRIKLLRHIKSHKFPSFIGPNKKSKHKTLHDYRFCIAYENSIEEDYVSEKLFDSYFAGCVPIYVGAPNVLEFVPKETFIDKRYFKSYEELYKYLKGMSEAEYNRYLDAISAFVHSPAIHPYTSEGHADAFIATYATS
jgi:alpha(1,3/1,4) fucosyltransferase